MALNQCHLCLYQPRNTSESSSQDLLSSSKNLSRTMKLSETNPWHHNHSDEVASKGEVSQVKVIIFQCWRKRHLRLDDLNKHLLDQINTVRQCHQSFFGVINTSMWFSSYPCFMLFLPLLVSMYLGQSCPIAKHANTTDCAWTSLFLSLASLRVAGLAPLSTGVCLCVKGSKYKWPPGYLSCRSNSKFQQNMLVYSK